MKKFDQLPSGSMNTPLVIVFKLTRQVRLLWQKHVDNLTIILHLLRKTYKFLLYTFARPLEIFNYLHFKILKLKKLGYVEAIQRNISPDKRLRFLFLNVKEKYIDD